MMYGAGAQEMLASIGRTHGMWALLSMPHVQLALPESLK